MTGLAPLATAGPQELAPLMSARYAEQAAASDAGAFLVTEDMTETLPKEESRPRIVVTDGHRALATLLEWLHPTDPQEPGVHPTAVLGAGVILGERVRIGAYAVLDPQVEVGDDVHIGAHTVVGRGARIGPRSILHPQVVVYPGSTLGSDVILHSGVRVGVDGFGYVLVDGNHRKVPQVGGCIVEDAVEVGANTTFDRGSIGPTVVGAGTKVDNLVQLGHNVKIGPRSILVSQTGIAGSTELGAGVVTGGQTGIGGHLRIGDGARTAGQAGIIGDVPPGETYMGFPGRPRTVFLRTAAAQQRLPDALKRLRALEREVEALKAALQESADG
jgi:UDP-3-O-[3-hydroxymyristoyl] glucosamine N-acyltransferase